MSKPKSDSEKEQPLIRFGNDWVPAHEVWDKMETVNVVADAIDRFNTHYPHLSSANTRDVVPLVRQRLKEIELRLPYKGGREDLAAIAVDLLDGMSPEDAIDVLEQKHGTRLSVTQLVQLAGDKAYRACLRREAGEYAQNRISSEQTADLWNELHRPAPGGGLWAANKIDLLLLSDD